MASYGYLWSPLCLNMSTYSYVRELYCYKGGKARFKEEDNLKKDRSSKKIECPAKIVMTMALKYAEDKGLVRGDRERGVEMDATQVTQEAQDLEIDDGSTSVYKGECSCPDHVKNRGLCKHIMACFREFKPSSISDLWGPSDLPVSLINHPLLVLDPHVLKIVKAKVDRPMVLRRSSDPSAPAQPRVEESPEQLPRATRIKMVNKMKERWDSLIRSAYEAEPDELRTIIDGFEEFVEKHTKPGAGNALFRDGVRPQKGSFAAEKSDAAANRKSARTGAAIRKTSGGKRKSDEGKADFNCTKKKAKKAAITTNKGLKESLLPLPPHVRLFGNSDAASLGLIGNLPNALSWMGVGGGEMGSLTRGKSSHRRRG